MRYLTALFIVTGALALSGAAPARDLTLPRTTSDQLKSACDKAGGKFSQEPKGYGCGTDCHGGPSTDCTVYCSADQKCTAQVIGARRPRSVADALTTPQRRRSLLLPGQRPHHLLARQRGACDLRRLDRQRVAFDLEETHLRAVGAGEDLVRRHVDRRRDLVALDRRLARVGQQRVEQRGFFFRRLGGLAVAAGDDDHEVVLRGDDEPPLGVGPEGLPPTALADDLQRPTRHIPSADELLRRIVRHDHHRVEKKTRQHDCRNDELRQRHSCHAFLPRKHRCRFFHSNYKRNYSASRALTLTPAARPLRGPCLALAPFCRS